MKFEEKLAKLESYSLEIQNTETDLEKTVGLYEQAMKLANEIEKDLSKLERRVEIATSEPDQEELKIEDYSE